MIKRRLVPQWNVDDLAANTLVRDWTLLADAKRSIALIIMRPTPAISVFYA